MGIAGVTAWRAVTELAEVSKGDKVLVLGSSGGVGSVIVSAAHALGATVWGQTRAKEHEDWITDLGADRVVVSEAEDLKGSLHAFEPTVVFDPLGGAYTGAAVSSMAAHGRLIIFGTSVAPEGLVPLQELYRKGLTIRGYAGLLEPDAVLDEAKVHALDALSEGRLSIPIDAAFPLEKVNDAFDRLSDGARQGKVILDLSD